MLSHPVLMLVVGLLGGFIIGSIGGCIVTGVLAASNITSRAREIAAGWKEQGLRRRGGTRHIPSAI